MKAALKHEKTILKIIKIDNAYNQANDLRDKMDGEGLNLNAITRKCENLFDRYLTELSKLPKRLQKSVEKNLNS